MGDGKSRTFGSRADAPVGCRKGGSHAYRDGDSRAALWRSGGLLFQSNPDGQSRASGAALFIWVWLIASVLNGAVGVFRAGIPVINSGRRRSIPIFSIPAAIAWYLAYRYGH